MDDLNKRLLNILQFEFPLQSRPYRSVASRLGITESDVLSRVRQLMEDGLIRRIGPVFDVRKLGFTTTLVAMKVPTEQLEEVAQVVNSYPQVTHNYRRDHAYNLWFTLVCERSEDISRVVEEIQQRTGIKDLQLLPAERTFKIDARFQLR